MLLLVRERPLSWILFTMLASVILAIGRLAERSITTSELMLEYFVSEAMFPL